jgi:aspartate/methionine/tyrosine aminotransferase
MFSRRSAFDARQNSLTVAFERARQAGRAVLDLTTSNPTRAGIPYETEAILSAFSTSRAMVYEPEPFGLLSAREAVARDWGVHGHIVDPARVFLTASTSEAYSFLFKLMCDPGDGILVPQPSYPLFEHLATFESVRVVPYPLAYDGEWHIDLPALRNAIDGLNGIETRPRAIVVVNPNNPTGSFLKKDELTALAATGLPIVSDEVFARYSLGQDPRRASSVLEAGDTASLVFALGGLSKLAALPQMKLAWTAVAGKESAVTEALSRLELIADSFLSVGTPIQHALPAILAARETTERAIVRRTASNLAGLRATLATAGRAATLLACEGGWYATLRLPRTQSETAWALSFLEDDGVHVHPGHYFDFADEAYVVVSLLTDEATFAEGVGRLLARVDRL